MGANPMIQALMSRLAGGQASRGGPAQSTGTPPGTPPGAAVARQFGELQQADPKVGQQKIEQMVGDLSALINQYALRIPGAAQSLARALPALQRALKEIQQAAQTMQAVGGHIQNSPAQVQPGETPGGGGAMPGSPAGSMPFLGGS